MTIVVNVEESPLEQVTKQLNKLVEVIKIVELDATPRSRASCCWSRSRPTPTTRGQVLEVVQLFRPRSSTSPPTPSPSRWSATRTSSTTSCAIVEPFGVRELVQSGMVAIGRGGRSISERTLRPVSVPAPPAAG